MKKYQRKPNKKLICHDFPWHDCKCGRTRGFYGRERGFCGRMRGFGRVTHESDEKCCYVILSCYKMLLGHISNNLRMMVQKSFLKMEELVFPCMSFFLFEDFHQNFLTSVHLKKFNIHHVPTLQHVKRSV